MSHGRQTNPDWGPLMWAVPSFVIPLAIGILTTALPAWWPVWAAAAVLVLVLAASVPKRGPLRPQNYGRTPAAVIAATGLTVAFVVVLWATAQHGHPLAVEVLPGLLLWAAATLLLRPLNKSAHISETGWGIATLGMAHATYTPDTARATHRQPPDSGHAMQRAGVPGIPTTPGFGAIVLRFDASAVVQPCSSSRCSPDPLIASLLRSRFPPRLLTGMTLRWFEFSACSANPEDLPPSPAQHASCWGSSTSPSLRH